MKINLIKLASVGRFILGLGILFSFFVGFPKVAQVAPTDMVMTLLPISPLVLLTWPLIIAGLYFTFSTKFRWRIDIFALIVAIACFSALFQNFVKKDIRGEAELEVSVLREGNQPVQNLEVDVAEKAGQPPEGGVGETDDKGVATFYIKPGNYYIFFNSNNFPPDLKYPVEKMTPVKVEEGKINQATIILKSK